MPEKVSLLGWFAPSPSVAAADCNGRIPCNPGIRVIGTHPNLLWKTSRARREGFQIFLTQGFLGHCPQDTKPHLHARREAGRGSLNQH